MMRLCTHWPEGLLTADRAPENAPKPFCSSALPDVSSMAFFSIATPVADASSWWAFALAVGLERERRSRRVSVAQRSPLNAGISRAVPSAPLLDTTILLTQEPITPIPPAPAADPSKLALGEELFRSLLLSRDQTRSCLSCHDVGSNGADSVQHAIGADGKPLVFNTPTVFNAAPEFSAQLGGRQTYAGISDRLGAQQRARSRKQHARDTRALERRCRDGSPLCRRLRAQSGPTKLGGCTCHLRTFARDA